MARRSSVRFVTRVRTQGTSKPKVYKGKDGREYSNLVIGAVETKAYDFTGRMIVKKGLEASERVLWLNAILFQRLIARTPRDENYTYIGNDGKTYYHKGEANPSAKNNYDRNNDHIQDYWTARYWNYSPITAKYLRESCGCTFEVLNDPSEIEVIYKEFRDRFFGAPGSRGRANKESGNTTLKGIRIYCDYPDDQEHQLRYRLLEFGGYTGDGTIKDGEKYYHGVANGHSVQAPAGMEAKTFAEFDVGQFRVPKSTSTENLLKRSGPSVNMTEKIKKILDGKKRLSESDVDKLMSLYGV